MQLFPTKNYTFKLNGDAQQSLELLAQNTLFSHRMSTQKTDRQFIGNLESKKFKIISSEATIGAFDVCEGNFSENELNMTLYINRPFKVLVFVILILMIFSATPAIMQYMSYKVIGFVVPIVMVILFLRYILLGIFFRRSTELMLGKIEDLLNVKKMD